MHIHRRWFSPAIVAVLAAAIVAGCGSTASPAPTTGASPSSPTPAASAVASPVPTARPLNPTPTPAPDPTPSQTPTASAAGDILAVYKAIEDEVIEIRGLPVKQRLEPRILDEAQLRAELKERFAEDMPPDKVADADALLKALGLIEPAASLETLYLGLMGSQVAGFYDLKRKTITVISRTGRIDATEKSIFAHEFNHALQDQSFDLLGIRADTVGHGDRAMAQLAVLEGDATLVMSLWMQKLDPAEVGELLKGNPEAEAALRKVPAFLRESLLFPYMSGSGFVMNTWMTAGWDGVNGLYSALPASTEQVIHPEKYQAREMPMEVTIDAAAATAALGPGWTAAPLDTFGEFQIQAWLSARGVPAVGDGSAFEAAAGWGGDRILVLRGPAGAHAVALFTSWDRALDADQFAAAAQKAIEGLPAAQVVRLAKGIPDDPDPARWAVLSASSPEILATLRDAVALPVP